MAVLERSPKGNIISKSVITWAIVGIAIYVSLLIWHATNLSNTNHFTKEIVNIGPIKLLEIQKTPLAGDGYKATFQFLLLGSLIYLLVLSLIAYGQIVYSTRNSADQPKKTPAKKGD